MKILLTGGNGYIATSIYQSLKSKYEIDVISRMNFDLTDTLKTNKFFALIVAIAFFAKQEIFL